MGFDALNWEDGQSNMPGLFPVGYIIAAGEVASMTIEDVKVTAIQLKDAAKFVPVYSVTDKPSLNEEGIGEASTAMASKATIQYPGTTEEAFKFLKQVRSTPSIYVVKEKSGRYRCLGTPDGPCVAEEPNVKNSSEENGVFITIKSTQDGPAPIIDASVWNSLTSDV